MKAAYEDIVNTNHIASFVSRENIADILALAQREHIAPASRDVKRSLLFAIDVQNDFMEGIGSLGVAGSKGDVRRLTKWMYRNLESLTSMEQILEHYATDRSITSRITMLEDCMFPIAGFENSTRQRFEELKDTYGVQIRKSTEVTI